MPGLTQPVNDRVGLELKSVEQPSTLSCVSVHTGRELAGIPGIHENYIFD